MIWGAGEPIQPSEYVGLGDVQECGLLPSRCLADIRIEGFVSPLLSSAPFHRKGSAIWVRPQGLVSDVATWSANLPE